ncbi:MAG: DUF1501 domain-containing protein [Armatimonadetes bacterium]|nr:DUF1501 domain-containing protein [Armatimonadota bacterium]
MQTTRRSLLATGALTALGWAARPRTALAALAVGPRRQEAPGGVLVTIFLRGGADGLNVVVPHGDDDYHRSRPTLGVADPVNLDGFFGLHPSLRPLLPLYEAGQMAVVHACGSGDQTRSHFEAMATVERGAFREAGPASGWLARHLTSAPWENESPLRAVALGAMVPETLHGAANATAMQTLDDLKLHGPAGREAALLTSLGSLYGADRRSLLGPAGREALAALKTLDGLSPAQRQPSHGAAYPADDLGVGLHQVATLIKAGVGLEAACLDHGGYDTHVAQSGVLADRLKSLGASLAAFAADLGPTLWADTTVVVLSEFGRRVEENDGAGTDHGRAGVMLALGGRGIAGGRVHGRWPGLAPAQREGPGDLKVTTDYRNVLAEIVSLRLGNPNVEAVFPGLAREPVGVVHG